MPGPLHPCLPLPLSARLQVLSYAEGQPRPLAARAAVTRWEVMTYPSAAQRLLGLMLAVALGKEALGSAAVDARGRCLGLVFKRFAGSKRRRSGGSGGGPLGSGAGAGDHRPGLQQRRGGRRRLRGQQEACGLVVPVPVITHFLRDIEAHGRSVGPGRVWRGTAPALLRHCNGTVFVLWPQAPPTQAVTEKLVVRIGRAPNARP